MEVEYLKIPGILVVEDKEENLEAAKEFFDSLKKFDVDYAQYVEEAKEKLNNPEKEYFLGIFDLDMPYREGESIQEKAGLELSEIVERKRKNMYYVFYSGGFYHGTPRTRVYLSKESVYSGKHDNDTYSKQSPKGWEELYSILTMKSSKEGGDSEEILRGSVERYLKYTGDFTSLIEFIGETSRDLIPFIFDRYKDIIEKYAKK